MIKQMKLINIRELYDLEFELEKWKQNGMGYTV